MIISVKTAVSSATVYPDRARVVCQGECDVEVGLHRLQVDDLPLTLEPESVRVTGKGIARVRLLGADVNKQFYEETPAANVRELESQIEALQDAAAALNDTKAGWEAHGRFLEGMRQATVEYAKGLSRGKTTVAEQAQIVAYLQEQDGELRTAVRELDQKLRQLMRQLDKLRRELKTVQSARPRQRYRAEVEIEVLEAGNFHLSVAYVVRQAGWQPLYDIRLLSDAAGQNSIELNYLAQIKQNSGQDWVDVALSVSTARPALNQRLPELHPWYVDEKRPLLRRQPTAVRSAKKMAMAAPMVADAELSSFEAAPEMAVAEVVTAEVQSNGATVTFAVAGTVTIPSDGSPHKNSLMQHKLEPKLDYLAVPKHTDAVYRRATITNGSDSPFLMGQANLFVGDEFIGRTKIKFTPTGGELELLLGVEDRVTVEREMVKRDVDKRFLRDARQLRYGYKIVMKNLMQTAVSVELHDHIPTSRHEQIKIKLDKVSPDPAERSDLNLLEWQVRLEVGGETAVFYEYTVEHPRTMDVVGLP